MAAPIDDLTPEQRAEVAADCDKAVELLTTEGWKRKGLWDYTPPHQTYQGGPLCAVGALSVARDEQRMRGLSGVQFRIDEPYELIAECLTGCVVADEAVARTGAKRHLVDNAFDLWRFNDDRAHGPDEVIGLLRDVAAKCRRDESDGGVL